MNISATFNSSYNNASLGIQRGMQGLENNSSKLASTEQLEGKANPTQSMIENRVDSLSARANLKVLSAVDGTLGTLLNVMA